MFVLVASITFLLGSGHATDAPVYTTGSLPKFIRLELVADPYLFQLQRQLTVLESRESSQAQQLTNLLKVADANSDFTNEFTEVFNARIDLRQRIQNSILDELEEKIAQIKAVRENVKTVQIKADDINNYINTEVYQRRKQIMYDVENLQNINFEQTAKIAETRNRADDVEKNIDKLVVKTCDNQRAANAVKVDLDESKYHLNAHRNGERTLTVYPEDEELKTVEINFEPAYIGVPQGQFFGLVGFHAVREKRYTYGYPTIYLGAFYQIHNKGLNVTGTDMSSGGWNVESINTKFLDAYFTANFRRQIK